MRLALKVLMRRARSIISSPPTRLTNQQLENAAHRASAWLAPWERAQLNTSKLPLSAAEKLYWQVFAVCAPVGLAYEVYVCENTVFYPSVLFQSAVTPEGASECSPKESQAHGMLLRGNHGCRSHMFIGDTEALQRRGESLSRSQD